MSESKSPEIPEEAVLFAEEQFGDLIIKPWTLKQLHEIYPVLREILARFQEQGLTFDNADTFFLEHGLAAVQDILPALPPLLAKTLRIEIAEAEEMAWDKAVGAALKIFVQNIGVLKNFSSPAVKALAAGNTPS